MDNNNQKTDKPISVDPLYIKHKDVLGSTTENFTIALCDAINNCLGSNKHALGAIKDRGVWLLYVSSENARAESLNRELNIGTKKIRIYDTNPFIKSNQHRQESTPSEIITIKGLLPNDDPDNKEVMKFFEAKEQLKIRSKIIHSRSRRQDNTLTNFFNGERHFFVEANFTPPLERECIIAGKKVIVTHKSQQKTCKRCSETGHTDREIDKCAAYCEDQEIITFNNNILSNMYPCEIEYNEMSFKSSEHLYQYLKCTELEMPQLANQVKEAENAFQAKRLTSMIDSEKIKKHWNDKKYTVMLDVLIAKLNSNDLFAQTLIDTGNSKLVEATWDKDWGCGLTPTQAQYTKVEFHPGNNMLGRCLETVREAALNKDNDDQIDEDTEEFEQEEMETDQSIDEEKRNRRKSIPAKNKRRISSEDSPPAPKPPTKAHKSDVERKKNQPKQQPENSEKHENNQTVTVKL